MFNLKRGQGLIFIVNVIYLVIALFVFSSRRNYEFVTYVGVVIFFAIVILATNKKVNYPNVVLWGLTLWGMMHMAGGGILLSSGEVLYKLILIPISESYQIFRYDQLVHIVGFGVSTLLMFSLLRTRLKSMQGFSFWLVIAMAGLGVGAVNEIIEFGVTVLVPETGVGGYINNSLDLVADLIGAIIAAIYIKVKNGKI